MKTTIKKPKFVGKGTFTPPEPKLLTKESQSGEYVYWEIGSETKTGILLTWADGLAIIETTELPKKRISIEVSN